MQLDHVPQFDEVLVRRYDVPGPRYTSYPTAPQFTPAFGEAELRAHADRARWQAVARPLSLYVHVPYCFSPCFYCGCTRVITRDRSKGREYVMRLRLEIERVAALFDPTREVMQLHLGGGTPNFLGFFDFGELLHALGQNFRLSEAPERDFSIELDPRHVRPGDIAALGMMGFNRASLGVQDFDPVVQRAVNRVQGVGETLAVLDACRTSGFRSVNVDLIYGLPKQTLAGFGRTLDVVLGARPDRLAIYGYAHLPELFKAQRQIEAVDLPGPQARLDLLALAIDKLGAAGYRYIGMDHFALPSDDLARAQAAGSLHRNFMGYTTHADCDLVGMGVSAISHVGNTFSQNLRELPAWERALDEGRLPIWRGMELDEDDIVRADVIQQIMCHGSVTIAAIERRHRIRFGDYFAPALAKLAALEADGLVTVDAARIAATPRGRLLLRAIAACFDAYLAAACATPAPRYSRVV
jgi:oxygen-independent coproporphyrinogen-3 oxidase